MKAFSFTQQFRPSQVVLAAAVALLLAGCQHETQQVMPEASHYYLNGQLSSRAAVNELPSGSIDRVDVLSGQQARTYAKDSAASGVVLVVTKQQEPR